MPDGRKIRTEQVLPRDHAMAANIVDLTHDALPENNGWRPIKKEYDRVPPEPVLRDKLLLREREMEQANEYFTKVYDRRLLDVDVFKKF